MSIGDQRADLLFPYIPVIPTGAKRSGGTCFSNDIELPGLVPTCNGL